jgi:hypothetical protein
LKEACAPVPVGISEFREELRRGRAHDGRREEALEARYA